MPRDGGTKGRKGKMLFSERDVGKIIEVRDGMVRVNGIFRAVQWRDERHPDGSATIVEVEVTLQGGVTLAQGEALPQVQQIQNRWKKTKKMVEDLAAELAEKEQELEHSPHFLS